MLIYTINLRVRCCWRFLQYKRAINSQGHTCPPIYTDELFTILFNSVTGMNIYHRFTQYFQLFVYILICSNGIRQIANLHKGRTCLGDDDNQNVYDIHTNLIPLTHVQQICNWTWFKPRSHLGCVLSGRRQRYRAAVAAKIVRKLHDKFSTLSPLWPLPPFT